MRIELAEKVQHAKKRMGVRVGFMFISVPR